jgi:hypothetical protein
MYVIKIQFASGFLLQVNTNFIHLMFYNKNIIAKWPFWIKNGKYNKYNKYNKRHP